ncbi:MAG: serine hydrolase [Pyrinomonadaceae bacterium]
MSGFRKIKRISFHIFTFWMIFSSADNTRSQDWKQYLDTEKAGWSSEQLEAAKKYAVSINSAAVMIVDQGNVVAAWGNIDHPYKAASIRKSIYDGTIGAVNLRKPFDPGTSIEKLGIDDIEPLSSEEKQATFEQLMTARSGIYHPAAYETESNAERRPERHSAKPGEKWYYNNWDFNVVTAAFEKLTDQKINDAFAEEIAVPLGMEDFKPDHVFDWFEPRVSRYPAATFRISARDLSRFGRLYLQKGKWNGKQIISPDWIKRSTSFLTTFENGHYGGEGNGYGRMWWIYPARMESGVAFEKHLRVAARGAGGQLMVLFPEIDLLIVHRADTDLTNGVSGSAVLKLMDLIVSARKTAPRKDAELGDLRVEPLSGKKPAPLRNDFLAVPENEIEKLEGSFMFSEKQGIRLYRYESRLFAQPLGMPLPDAEMFKVADKTLRSPLVNIVIRPVFETDRNVETLEITFNGQTLSAKRRE